MKFLSCLIYSEVQWRLFTQMKLQQNAATRNSLLSESFIVAPDPTFCLIGINLLCVLTIFFVLQNTVNVFQVSAYNEISGQPSKSSHIWDARWGLRGWLASGQFLFSLSPSLFPSTPCSPPPYPLPFSLHWFYGTLGQGTGGRKILFFLPLCSFWIQGWDRKTRRILKREDLENTENKDNDVYTKGLSDDTVAWIQYLWAVLITTRKLKKRKMSETGYLQEVGFKGGGGVVQSCCFLL